MRETKWNTHKRYYTLDAYYKSIFHQKVAKISINGGFTCPNIDGRVGYGGCIYCSSLGSGDFAGKETDSLTKQFQSIQQKIDKKWKNCLYIGYFQAHTNTYAPLTILKEKYGTILAQDKVVGLAIATRPDAIKEEVMDYLEELSKNTYIQVELGLQTIHEKTSTLINRCHTLECFTTCVANLRKRNINVVVHIINGLPYETKSMMIQTIQYINQLDIQGIKIHMLHILKNTKLAKIYAQKHFPIVTKEEYINIVCDQLEYIRPNIVIHRITGDPDMENLIGPSWIENKIGILNAIDKELQRRKTYQGFRLQSTNLLKQIIEPILRQKDYVIDLTHQYQELLQNYLSEEQILHRLLPNMQGKITLIIINTTMCLQKYLSYLHPRGFLLIITKRKISLNHPFFHLTYYQFERELYIIKVDKS